MRRKVTCIISRTRASLVRGASGCCEDPRTFFLGSLFSRAALQRTPLSTTSLGLFLAPVPFPRALTCSLVFPPAPFPPPCPDPLLAFCRVLLSVLVCESVCLCRCVCVCFGVFCLSVSVSVCVCQLEDMHKAAETASRQLSYPQGVPGGGSA